LELIEEAIPDLPNVRCWLPSKGAPPLFLHAKEGAFSSNDDVVAWTAANRDRLDALIIEFGAIVLRDFPIVSAEHFNAVISVFPIYQRGYIGGGGPREKITGNVMEATQLDETMRLSLHSEMGYTQTFPPRLAFFSRKPAEVGGETTIGNMRRFMAMFPEDLREKLDRLGGRTVRNFAPRGASKGKRVTDHPDKRGWDDAFSTEDEAEVEQHCAAMGMRPIWNQDGTLTLITDLEPFATHPVTGERFYRLQIHTNKAFETPERIAVTRALRASQKIPSGHSMGNGEPLPDEDCETIRQLYCDVTVEWPWQAGDVMILDNLIVNHGRNPYEGTRDTQVALLDR
jgi:alpha-ketoglutarate-dependent taurine dioxygenase